MSTIITHLYNEEYLLPRWLKHHRKYFDKGILIDYASTDNSVQIIKEICPDWLVVPSVNAIFQADLIDAEVMQWEEKIEGWRIALNVTEFLVGNINNIQVESNNRLQYLIPSVSFFDWDPDGSLDPNKELWEQKHIGVSYHTDFHGLPGRWARSFHNFNDMKYPIGRHFQQGYSCENPLIFHYANCISTPEMLARRLQIQTKISDFDKQLNRGLQHTNSGKGLTRESVLTYHQAHSHKFTDCSSYIQTVTS